MGALLKAPERLPPGLSTDLFGKAPHRHIVQAMLELARTGSPVNVATLTNQLQISGHLESVGGMPFLESLRSNPDYLPEHIPDYIERLEALRRYRLVYTKAQEAQEKALGADAKAFEVLRELDALLSSGGGGSIKSMADAMDAYGAFLEGKRLVRLTTPWPSLDSVLYLSPGMLITIAARPGMGKSAFALQLTEHLAKEHGPVWYVSLEMSAYELGLRTLSRISQVPLSRLREAELRPLPRPLLEKVTVAMEEVASLPILIEDNPLVADLANLRIRAKVLKGEYGLSAIVIDYIQLMVDAEARIGGNVVQATAAVSRELKLLARELEIPVFALSQLSRAVELRTDKRPRLSDLRDSGAIEQDSDAVVFLFRPGYYQEDGNNYTEVIVAKQRQGPLDTVGLIWHPPFLSFHEGGLT